ncbi:30S ribosomal protein S6e [Candidatus Woesearchaeota archaeon]|nr:30S ribosomal protein S6e [Candidatus Woesearchaeota archaeon]
MADIKLVLGLKDGKSVQKELKGAQAEALLGKRLSETVSGDSLGFSGYEFLITGGSDICGFPMRKGIQEARKRVLVSGGVGFSGLKRDGSKQKGVLRRRTVCGEVVVPTTHQVNMKVVKEGSTPLVEPAVTETAAKKE